MRREPNLAKGRPGLGGIGRGLSGLLGGGLGHLGPGEEARVDETGRGRGEVLHLRPQRGGGGAGNGGGNSRRAASVSLPVLQPAREGAASRSHSSAAPATTAPMGSLAVDNRGKGRSFSLAIFLSRAGKEVAAPSASGDRFVGRHPTRTHATGAHLCHVAPVGAALRHSAGDARGLEKGLGDLGVDTLWIQPPCDR